MGLRAASSTTNTTATIKEDKNLKAYLDNLGTSYRVGCYNEKKPAVCHLLGDYFENVQNDWTKAAKIYEVNCDQHNYAQSCFKYGNYVFLGRNSKKVDHKKSVHYFEKGCKLKYPKSCLHAGLMYSSMYSDVKLPKDPKAALGHFDTGCSMDNADSCYYVSGMFLAGVDDIIGKDMEKAFQYSKKACHLGHKLACANLSVMYKKGEGVAKDENKALEYEVKATNMKDKVVEQFRNIAFEQPFQQKI